MEELDGFAEESEKAVREVPNTVAILAGESVAGQALELLLQSIGYRTRFLVEPLLDDVNEMLDEVQISILAPTVSEKYREDFLRNVERIPAMAGKPILELVTSASSLQPLTQGRVLWPCRIEELQREIEAALLIGAGDSRTLSMELDTDPANYDPEDVADTRTA